jgi:hypothetical protein
LNNGRETTTTTTTALKNIFKKIKRKVIETRELRLGIAFNGASRI